MDIDSDAPAGAVLGGSSALVTGVVAGLAMLGERRLDAHELARISYSIERDDLGISGGWQDQYAAAFGGLNLFEFSRLGVLVSPVRASARTLGSLQDHLLLCYTGFVRRNAGLIDAQIDLYREGREDTILGMKQLQEIAYAMRDAVEEGDVDELGAMLHDAFVAKRRMNPHIAEHTRSKPCCRWRRPPARPAARSAARAEGLSLGVLPPLRAGVRAARDSKRLGAQFAPFAFRARRGPRVPRRRRVGADGRGSGVNRRRRRPWRRHAASLSHHRGHGPTRRGGVPGGHRVRGPTILVASLSAGGKILICGNGGSAADAQHLGDGVRQHAHDGQPPPVDPGDRAHHRHVAPDRDRERLRYRGHVRAPGRVARPPRDVLIAISTSGNSANVIRAAERARGFGSP
jgi:hypothetical protein